MSTTPKIDSYKNFIVLPEGDLINLDHVAKVYVGVDVGTDDNILYFILGVDSASVPATSGSHAYVPKTYANNAAAVAAFTVIQNALVAMGKAVDLS